MEIFALVTKCPEFSISERESKELTKRIKEVQKHYPVQMNAKYVAIINLLAMAGLIFIPRGMAVAKRIRVQRAAAKAEKPDAPKPKA